MRHFGVISTTAILYILTILPELSCGRHVLKRRSPQISLTVIEDEEESTPRQHPPSIEDLEERRKALVKALIPGGNAEPGSTPPKGQLQGLADLGLDLVNGSLMNAGELFAPLRNATKRARENFPRVGDVINRAVDSAREYRTKVQGALRTTASSTVSNGVRIFTTISARATEVLGGVFKVLRSLFDNFTLAIQNLAQMLSRSFARFSQIKTRLLTRGFTTARNVVQNGKLFAPLKAASELGGNFVKGVASDLNMVQPWVNEEIMSKLTLGSALVPRINLARILSPVADSGSGSSPTKPGENEAEDPIEIGDTPTDGTMSGGYAGKREMGDMKMEDIPKDILELLSSPSASSSTSTTESPSKNEVLTLPDNEEDEKLSSVADGDKTSIEVLTTELEITSKSSVSSVDDLFGIGSENDSL